MIYLVRKGRGGQERLVEHREGSRKSLSATRKDYNAAIKAITEFDEPVSRHSGTASLPMAAATWARTPSRHPPLLALVSPRDDHQEQNMLPLQRQRIHQTCQGSLERNQANTRRPVARSLCCINHIGRRLWFRLDDVLRFLDKQQNRLSDTRSNIQDDHSAETNDNRHW